MFTAATTAQLSSWWQRSGGGGLPAGQAVLSSAINYAYQQYSQSSVSYVGPDSSNRPVFFFAYANASNQLRAQMWRIEDDGTITQGSEQSAGAQSCSHAVQSMSEYEGANGFGAGSGSYVYMAYVDSGITQAYVQAASINQDALTCTFGTALTQGGDAPDFDGGVVAYVGNSTVVAGHRAGTGMILQRYTRSGTTMSAAGTQVSDVGYRIDPAELGFAPDGTTQYRSAYFDTGNGASGTVYGATEFGSTNYNANNTSITTSSQNFGCNLNNTDKMLGTYNVSGTISSIAVPITWNSASAPTFSTGNAVSTVTPTGSGGSWFPVSGFATDAAYVVYNDTASTISYVPVTATGNAVSVGSSVQMFSGLSNFYYQMAGSSAKIGTKTYLSGVQIRSTATPYIYGYRLS